MQNYPSFGLAHGTGFPFYFYEDHRRQNRRINLLEQPLTCYELGHRGSIPPYTDKTTAAPEDVHLPIDMAVRYHWVINWFYHPVYIHEYPLCRKGIDAILDHIRRQGYRVAHMGANAAAEWWRARDRSRASLLKSDARGVRLRTRCAFPAGMVVKLPWPDPVAARAVAGRTTLRTEVKEEFGGRWLYVVVPHGRHEIRLTNPVKTRAERS